MKQAIKMFMESNRQTKIFIFTLALYLLAILWTTIQSYARLEYSRSDSSKPIMIQMQPSDQT